MRAGCNGMRCGLQIEAKGCSVFHSGVRTAVRVWVPAVHGYDRLKRWFERLVAAERGVI